MNPAKLRAAASTTIRRKFGTLYLAASCAGCAHTRAFQSGDREGANALRQGRRDRESYLRSRYHLHAEPFGQARRRSAGAFSLRDARRPLRVFCFGDDHHAAHAGDSFARGERVSCPANTTIWQATTSCARATRTAGWKLIFRATDGSRSILHRRWRRTFGILSRLGQYIDWMELSWNEWVINYDFAHQVQMAQVMQRNTRNWTESARAWFSGKADERQELAAVMAEPARCGYLCVAGCIDRLVGAACVMTCCGWLSGGCGCTCSFARRSAASANPQLASRLYAELLRLLERRGFARRDSQTPLEFAAAVGEPGLAPAVREFTQIYAHARFGGVPCDALRLRGLLEQVRAGLRSR